MIIYIIRHGQTSANEAHRYCGRTDLPLSSYGLKQLNDLKASGNWPEFDHCFHSGLKRTVETAKILFPETPATSVELLREFDFGDFEMKDYLELKDIPAYRNWIDKIETEQCPNGESQTAFRARIESGWQHVLDVCRQFGYPSAALVTHGGVIATLMASLFPDQNNFYEWQPACGEGYRLSLEGGQLVQFNAFCPGSKEKSV